MEYDPNTGKISGTPQEMEVLLKIDKEKIKVEFPKQKEEKLELEPQKPKAKKKNGKIGITKVKEMIRKGASAKKIARKFGVTPRKIYQLGYKYKMHFGRKRRRIKKK